MGLTFDELMTLEYCIGTSQGTRDQVELAKRIIKREIRLKTEDPRTGKEYKK